MTNQDICIAVDFGGTKMLVGAVTETGEILATSIYKTGFRKQSEAAQAVLQNLDAFIQARSWGQNRIAAVGIGLVGKIDFDKGIWYLMYNDADDQPIPLASIITEKYHVPCVLDNDVKVALAAEHAYGSGAECENFTYVNVGTGIASGSICDGRVVRGHENNAGEIGHYVVDRFSDVVCFCGRHGCVEAIASGFGILDRCKKIAAASPATQIASLLQSGKLDTIRLFALADNGDIQATAIAEDAVYALIVLIGNVICSYSPETIVLGGGLFCDDWIFPKIMAALPEAIVQSGVNIRKTTLDPRTIGLKGAAVIGFAAVRRDPHEKELSRESNHRSL